MFEKRQRLRKNFYTPVSSNTLETKTTIDPDEISEEVFADFLAFELAEEEINEDYSWRQTKILQFAKCLP